MQNNWWRDLSVTSSVASTKLLDVESG